SEWSDEASFATGAFPFTAVPFDLTRHFNRDVVADPGDRSNDALDDEGGLLIVEGFDGVRADSPVAHGLPRDRRLGVHVLGDYARPNAVLLLAGSRPVRVETPRARYAFVRLLVAGGGDSLVPLALEFADGSRAERQVPCDDWYDDNPPEGPAGSLR